MSYSRGKLLACNPNPTRLVPVKLSSDPKGEKIVYVNGRGVIVRDLNDPTQSVSYSEHTQPTTVARISPSGYYCASADVSGTVRIWDIAGTDQVLKLTTKPLGGRINDLAWDGESKRIIVGGDGREAFGAAFLADSGSSCGVIQGHSQVINSVSIRRQRPFRAVTASDDGSIVFYTGVPFKYEKLIRTHTKFVQDVQYSGSGDHFASVGSDGKLFFYDGKDGNTLSEIDAHKGTIMASSWSPDSKRISTAGADGTVKLWDIERKEPAQTFTIGSDLGSQQNGTVWASENSVVSLGLDGTLFVWDPRSGEASKKIYGPSKAVTSAALSLKPEPTFYTGSFDGSMKAFSFPEGECAPVAGNGPDGKITGVTVDQEDGTTYATSWAAGAGLLKIEDKKFVSDFRGDSPIQGSRGISASEGHVAVVDIEGLSVFKDGKKIKGIQGSDGFTSVAVHKSYIAYGSADKKIRLTTMDGDNVTEFDDNRGAVISLAFSSDGHYLAGGDTSGRIVLIDVAEKKTLVSSKWTFHSSRVTTLAFSPDNLRLLSGGLDESIYIWSVTNTMTNLGIKNAHRGGVSGVGWQDDENIISAGEDACARTWKVTGI